MISYFFSKVKKEQYYVELKKSVGIGEISWNWRKIVGIGEYKK